MSYQKIIDVTVYEIMKKHLLTSFKQSWYNIQSDDGRTDNCCVKQNTAQWYVVKITLKQSRHRGMT